MRRLFLGADKAISFLTRFFIVVTIILLAVMALIGTADVISSNLLGRPIPAATEIASALLPIVVMLAMSYAQQNRANIRVELFSGYFPSRLRRFFLYVELVLGTLVFLMLSWGSWRLALDSVAVSESAVAAIRFPIWPMKLVFAVGACVCTLQMLRGLVHLAVLGEQSPFEEGAEG